MWNRLKNARRVSSGCRRSQDADAAVDVPAEDPQAAMPTSVGGDGSLLHPVNLVRIHRPVADMSSLSVEPAYRLNEESRLGQALRHGRFGDIQFHLVHGDVRVGA